MTDDHHTIGDAIVRIVDAIENDEPRTEEFEKTGEKNASKYRSNPRLK